MSQNLTVRLAKITGTPSKSCWSQTHTFFPEDSQKQKKRGILLACFSFSGAQQGVEAVAAGREILSRLHEEFYGELEQDSFSKLSSAVDKVCQEFSRDGQNLEIVAACLLGEVLYLAAKGGGQAWVRREGAFQKVLQGEAVLGSASGFLKPDDLLILGTASFFEIVPQGVLKASLESGDLQEAVEALAPLIGGQDDSSKITAIIGKVEEEERVEEVVEEAQLPEAPETPETEGKKIPFDKKAFSLLTGFLSKISRFFPEKIYLRPKSTSFEEQKKKRMAFSLALILIILLGVSLYFGTRKGALRRKQGEYEAAYQETLTLFEEGQALVGLNPSASRQQLFAAKDKLTELESLEIEKEKTDDLKKRIEEALAQVVKEKKIGEAEVFFDLGLIAAEARGERLCLGGEFLLVLDKDKNRLFAVEVGKKSGKILAGGEDLAGAKLITSYGGLAYVLTDKGIFQIGLEGEEKKVVIKKQEVWEEIGAFSSYAGNLYLLDKKGKVWRYPRTEEGFGTGKNWFGEGISPDLSGVVSMAIDGSIWVLRQDGKILKFTLGALDAFGIAGLEKPLDKPSVLYTDSESENLYVLDRGNGRVVVLAKSGEYQFQYQWEGAREAQDMAVSEEKGKIFILKQEKIYEINLESSEGL